MLVDLKKIDLKTSPVNNYHPTTYRYLQIYNRLAFLVDDMNTIDSEYKILLFI